MKTQTVPQSLSVPEIKEYKNKYRLAAEQIYEAIGVGNYQNVYHCVTRFRCHIIDKSLVDIPALKKIQVVKEARYSGDELQVIIGGEVYKVVDEFKKYEVEVLSPAKTAKTDITVKKSVWTRILGFLNGVMAPCVPIFMVVAMVSALYALLTLPGNEVLKTSIIVEGQPDPIGIDLTNLYLFDIWSSIFFILNKVVISSLGMFFIINTTKYYKGNILLAAAVGLTLISRGFYPVAGTGVDFAQAGFGDWTSSDVIGKSGFLLFKLGQYPIFVLGYESGVIPFIIAGVLVVLLDKWIKTWMPSVVDIVFRPFLVYLISMLGLWFIFAPISGLIEFGLVKAVMWFSKIPYGIGVGIYAMFWQPLILIGAGAPASMPVVIALTGDPAEPQILMIAMEVGAWTQTGIVIGLAIISKNKNFSKLAWGTIPAGIFGVTEPMIYGITLPKVKPFLYGCATSFISGIILGIIDVPAVRLAGYGVLSYLGIDLTVKNILMLTLVYAIAIGISILAILLFYKERKNELTYFQKAIKKLNKAIYGKENKNDKELLTKEFKPYLDEIKSMKQEFKKMSNYYSEISKYEQQLITVEGKESKHRARMYKELTALRPKLVRKQNSELLTKFTKLNDKYSDYNLDKEKDNIQNKLNKLESTNNAMINHFNSTKENIYNKSVKIIDTHQTAKMNDYKTLEIKNQMWNALNSVEIGYGIEDAKPIKFKKRS